MAVEDNQTGNSGEANNVVRRRNIDVVDKATIIVSFTGNKVQVPLTQSTTVGSVIEACRESCNADQEATIQLLYQGKQWNDVGTNLYDSLLSSAKARSIYKFVAIQKRSADVVQAPPRHLQTRVIDDLTDEGQKARRRGMIRQQQQGNNRNDKKYGFGRVQPLENLPDVDKARALLQKLASDPGVLACMQKHQWNVGTLAELYPEGKVGSSPVCVMGLNRNKGESILLRLRTDDLKGFRKIASIRQVLFHELAHNVHSEHNQDFFVLMRQIEKECVEMDWTNGAGLSSDADMYNSDAFQGGTYKLGGSSTKLSPREMAARAAAQRQTAAQEQLITDNCGCGGHERGDLFLPQRSSNNSMRDGSGDASAMKEDDNNNNN